MHSLPDILRALILSGDEDIIEDEPLSVKMSTHHEVPTYEVTGSQWHSVDTEYYSTNDRIPYLTYIRVEEVERLRVSRKALWDEVENIVPSLRSQWG